MINYQSPAPAARPPRLLHRSRGYSLVEMLVVMSASAMVLMVAYTLLVLVMKRTAGGNDELAFAESTSRISARFRQIVHESAELKVADDGQVLEMTSGTAAAAQWLQLASGPLRLELVEDHPLRLAHPPLHAASQRFSWRVKLHFPTLHPSQPSPWKSSPSSMQSIVRLLLACVPSFQS